MQLLFLGPLATAFWWVLCRRDWSVRSPSALARFSASAVFGAFSPLERDKRRGMCLPSISHVKPSPVGGGTWVPSRRMWALLSWRRGLGGRGPGGPLRPPEKAREAAAPGPRVQQELTGKCGLP